MPALEYGGPWSVWDVRALRPAPRIDARTRPRSADRGTLDPIGRLTRMGNDRNGRARQEAGGDERLEVLRLLQAGEITAEEAAQLLDALDRSEAGARATTGSPGAFAVASAGRGGAQIRLRVSNSATGKPNVNLALPLGLIGAGVAVAKRFAPDHVPDPAVLRDALASGLRGKILDVDDDGERVEIWVE
jgi:hypothetical protein